ncbi:16S rRNA (uracil(1498)-N(3))-methyltransferase [Neisseria leonii]|uniref:16S rRNA (uracil(1498)-N(3))-methyltransferase n=1 Tax=Neisseria leonii TaxID=2995413 RepID=UPI00237C1148|nr:16S rRNA (uracil(1498)-N(3))-methyltransferase [Neisseria sp. 3986]MDD9324949.1 16S rRNA (uracil(1498)-N(3))-methyltransferase [Neisseria sp. 3986]
MPRFFVPDDLAAGRILTLPDNVVRHMQVLRLRAGGEVVFFNGNGRAYPARLVKLEKRTAVAEITAEGPSENMPPLAITLIQAVSAGERMDFTLQKSVELGVTEIIPVISERSVVRLSGERAEKRVARWQEIVIAACEQSGRNRIPPVRPLQNYTAALNTLPADRLKLLMSLNRAEKLSSLPPPKAVLFMVGPEGGWTAAEEAAAFDAGFQAITLGNRILRTETASLAAIAAMQTLWGDFA